MAEEVADVEEVAADGSPVPVFLALPSGDAPRMIHDAAGPGASILELGCGAGRVTRPLVAFGHHLVAVDDTPAMLEHVTGAEKVCADLYTLSLGRTFDAVVAGSYLVNTPDTARRQSLYQVCRNHVTDDGVVLMQRHAPDWVVDPADSEGTAGPVDVSFQVLEQHGDGLRAAVTYRLGTRSWTVPFTAAIIDDARLAEEAAGHGLTFDRSLDPAGTWVRLRPSDPDPGRRL